MLNERQFLNVQKLRDNWASTTCKCWHQLSASCRQLSTRPRRCHQGTFCLTDRLRSVVIVFFLSAIYNIFIYLLTYLTLVGNTSPLHFFTPVCWETSAAILWVRRPADDFDFIGQIVPDWLTLHKVSTHNVRESIRHLSKSSGNTVRHEYVFVLRI